MSAPLELKLLRSIKTGKGLIKLIKSLQDQRRLHKETLKKIMKLSKKQREAVLAKTNAHCHICGIPLHTTWQADHVKAHSAGGTHEENNYLPACNTCNNYRWHYSSEEIQIILKLGVWVKTKIATESKLAMEISNEFVKYEMGVRKRKKGREEIK